MADEGPLGIERSARPGVEGPPDVVRPPLEIKSVVLRLGGPHVLLDDETVGIRLLQERVDDPPRAGAEQPLVARAVDRVRRMPPERDPALERVTDGIVAEGVVRIVHVVRELRLDHNARFVRRLEVFRRLAVRVKPDVVEAARPRLHQVIQVVLARRRRHAGDRIRSVIPEPAEEEALAVQVELLAAHFELPDAEALLPRLHDLAVLQELDLRPVEVRMLGGPGAEVPKRNFQGEVRR